MTDLLGRKRRQLGTECATSCEQVLATVGFGETERFGELGVFPAVEVVEQNDLALDR